MKKNIQNLIKELIKKTNLISGDINIKENITKDGSTSTCFSVEIKTEILENRENEIIVALNHLARRMIDKLDQSEQMESPVNLQRNFQRNFMIDINDFQKKCIENLQNKAHIMMERARSFKSDVEEYNKNFLLLGYANISVLLYGTFFN